MTSPIDVDQQAFERLLLYREVEDFLFAEVELLDSRRYDEWLDLLADDMHYWMPILRNVKFGHQDREETSDQTDVSWFDEPKTTLVQRVLQLHTGVHWAEEPISRVTHVISNVHIVGVEGPEIRVNSRFVVYRNRLRDEEDFFVGKREDTLRRVDGQLKLARRKVILDQNVLLAKNITIFF